MTEVLRVDETMVAKLMATRLRLTEPFHDSRYKVSPVSFLRLAVCADAAVDTDIKLTSRRSAMLLLTPVIQFSVPNSAVASPTGLHLDSSEMFSASLYTNMPLPEAQTGVEIFHVASMNTKKTPGSNLGLLACLIFGFLYLKEKRARIATNVALEDAQLQIKLADTGLRTQAQSNLNWKSKNSKRTSDLWISSKDCLLTNLTDIKSHVDDLVKKVEAQKQVSESLRWQLKKARTSIAEVERLCNDLVQKLNKEIRQRWIYETDLQNINIEVQQKADKVNNLRTTLAKAGLISENLNHKVMDYEDSHSKFLIKLQDLLVQLGVFHDSLLASEESLQLLRKQLDCTVTRNEAIELRCSELCKELHSGKELLAKELTELNQQLHTKSEHFSLISTELTTGLDRVNMNKKAVQTLIVEREELKNIIHENDITISNLNQLLDSVQKELRECDSDLHEAHEQLIQENAKKVFLEATYKSNPTTSQFVKLTLELQQIYNEANDLTTKLENELSSARETLKSSELEVSSLRTLLQSTIDEEEQLRNELTRLYEDKQLVAQAIKKEKRSAAYAKKKLALCNEVLKEHNGIIQEIQDNEFRESRSIIHRLKDEVSFNTAELENANKIITCLEEEMLELEARLNNGKSYINDS